MVCEPLANNLDIEDRAFGCADRILEGLEAGGAKVEGETFEGGTIRGFLGYVGSGACGVCVRGVPLGVGDLGRSQHIDVVNNCNRTYVELVRAYYEDIGLACLLVIVLYRKATHLSPFSIL